MAKKCSVCGGVHYAKGFCKFHYKMPSQLKPKPILSKIKTASNTLKDKESLPFLLERAEKVFNRWIRNRDAKGSLKFRCISCGFWKPVDQMDAGHFHSKTYSILRFDEKNVNGECVICNRLDPDHLFGYAKNLILKIGIDEFQRLEEMKKIPFKWDRHLLLDLIKKYETTA